MQPYLLNQLRARLQELGLSAYEDRFLPHAQLAFDLRLDGASEGIIGESRWGGAPDVPVGFEWPMADQTPMTFLAQINLADLTTDAENPFPQSGWLHFFADLENYQPDSGFVTFLRGNAELHPTQRPSAGNNVGDVPAHRLKLESRADLPQWATNDYVELTEDLSDEEQDAYSQLSLSDTYMPTPQRQTLAGQLLGHSAGIGADPREYAFERRELGSNYSFEHDNAEHQRGIQNWQNLLRFDSVLNLCIGDAGYLNFLVHRDALQRLDFTRVVAAVESS